MTGDLLRRPASLIRSAISCPVFARIGSACPPAHAVSCAKDALLSRVLELQEPVGLLDSLFS